MRSEPAHLFGVEGAEILFDDPAEVYERDIEPYHDPAEPRTIVEWTARYADDALPDVDTVVEMVALHYAEGEMAPDDDGKTGDRMEGDEGVRAAAAALIEAMRQTIVYRWTDTEIATHTITWDDDGQPLLNGEPLYNEARPRPYACSRCGAHDWLKDEHVGPARRCCRCGHVAPEPLEVRA